MFQEPMPLASFSLVSPTRKVPVNEAVVDLMDINNPTRLDLELMSMKEHLLHSQVPFHNSLFPYSYIPLDHIPSTTFNCQVPNLMEGDDHDLDQDLGAAKEMMYRIASMQPVETDTAAIRKPERKNVRISDDPQSIAARLRREEISEKMRVLRRLVPGGSRLDTASMLDEAFRYIKFLKRQIRLLQPNHQPQSINFSLDSSSSTPIDWSLKANGGSASTEPPYGNSTGGGKIDNLKHEEIELEANLF